MIFLLWLYFKILKPWILYVLRHKFFCQVCASIKNSKCNYVKRESMVTRRFFSPPPVIPFLSFILYRLLPSFLFPLAILICVGIAPIYLYCASVCACVPLFSLPQITTVPDPLFNFFFFFAPFNYGSSC